MNWIIEDIKKFRDLPLVAKIIIMSWIVFWLWCLAMLFVEG